MLVECLLYTRTRAPPPKRVVVMVLVRNIKLHIMLQYSREGAALARMHTPAGSNDHLGASLPRTESSAAKPPSDQKARGRSPQAS